MVTWHLIVNTRVRLTFVGNLWHTLVRT